MSRLLRTLPALVLTAALTLLGAPAAWAAPAPPVGTIALRPGSQPEGIAAGPGTTYYAGAMSDGAIYTGDLRTGSRRLLVPGRAGHAVRGLQYDPGTGVLWAAGEVRLTGSGGTRSQVLAYRATTGRLLRTVTVPGQRFLNDVQVVGHLVYVTDSLHPELVVVRPSGSGLLRLSGGYTQPPAGSLGLNGIRALPGGDLLVTDSATGALFRVDPATGRTSRLPVSGRALSSGDGLVLRGSTLYVVYGFGTNAVAVVHLTPGARSGRVVGVLRDPDLDRPTTAVLALGALYAVNGRFPTPPTPTTPYAIVRVPLG